MIMRNVFCFLLLLYSFPMKGWTQINCASEDITFTTVITDAVCQSDGQITVTRGGADEDNYFNYFYHLEPTVAGGFSTQPAIGETITMIPPGTYNLIVTATCKDDANTKYRHTIRNLKVGGDYEVIKAHYDQKKSRASFASCPMGTIVLNVSAGLGTYQFKIISAPPSEGVTAPVEVVPTRIPDTDLYAFPRQNYPPGDYLVQVTDNQCYTATVNLKIPEVDVPFITYPVSPGYFSMSWESQGCQYLAYTMSVSPSFYSGKPQYELIADSELFEFSLVKAGDTPTDWRNVRKSGTREVFDMSPHSVVDFYAPNSLELHVRMKACPEIKQVHPLQVYPFGSSYNYLPGCTQYQFRLIRSSEFYCYPLTIRYYRGTNNTGELLREDQIPDRSYNNPYINFDYNTQYYAEMTDNYGNIAKRTFSRNKYLTYNTSDRECGGYVVIPALAETNYSACPSPSGIDFTYRIYDITGLPSNQEGTLVCERTNNNPSELCVLEYGRTYRLRFFPSYDPEISYEVPILRNQIQTRYYVGVGGTDVCRIDYGYFYVSRNVAMKPGTRITFRGPNGFYQEEVLNNLTTYYRMEGGKYVYMPPGDYTVTVVDACGETFTENLNHPGVYNYRDFDYTQTADCSSLCVFPQGAITYRGEDKPENTYFRIISGPSGGYQTKSYKINEEIKLTREGFYTLAIHFGGYNCNLATKVIEFKRPQIQLARKYTAAYACVGGTTIGQIYVKGEKGEEPYTYELWNADNTVQIPRPNGVEENHWPLILAPYNVAFFEYGAANESYTVRIGDKCLNHFSQKLTIGDLTNLTIAGTPNDVVCVGDEIQLTCLPLQVYTWTGPAGFTSSEQNPVIPFATRNMSGRYKVVVNPPNCGREYVGYVNIQVVPCYAPVNPALMNRGNLK